MHVHVTSFVVPSVQCVPYLIAMATDPELSMRNKSDQQLVEIDKKYTGFIHVSLCSANYGIPTSPFGSPLQYKMTNRRSRNPPQHLSTVGRTLVIREDLHDDIKYRQTVVDHFSNNHTFIAALLRNFILPLTACRQTSGNKHAC